MIPFLFLVFSIISSGLCSTKPCSEVPSDVVFIIDASESISEKDFLTAKQFVIDMINFIIETNQLDRVAFVVFGDNARIYFNFTKYSKLDDMINAVKATVNKQEFTAIGKALNLTLVELVPTMRKSANKLVIMLTDGTNNIYPSPLVYANHLKDAQVKITAIGIGKDVNKNELTKIASPNSVYTYNSFSELVVRNITLSREICPVKEPIPNNLCDINILDLVILLDNSGSIGMNNFRQAKEFLKQVLRKTDLGVNKTRIALLSFSHKTRIDVDFQLNDRKEILKKVDSIESIGGATGIGLALQETQKKFFPKRRPNVPFNILLITDGYNNIKPRPVPIAKFLKKDGANIITLGVGKAVDIEELNAISSKSKVLTVDSFGEIMSSLKTLLKTITCGS